MPDSNVRWLEIQRTPLPDLMRSSRVLAVVVCRLHLQSVCRSDSFGPRAEYSPAGEH